MAKLHFGDLAKFLPASYHPDMYTKLAGERAVVTASDQALHPCPFCDASDEGLYQICFDGGPKFWARECELERL